MQWLTSLKRQYCDPVDLMRFHIIPKKDLSTKEAKILNGRWLVFSARDYELKQSKLKNSLQKINRVKKLVPLLRKSLPFVELIAISGSVSSLHATKNDDIDLFIVTQPKRLSISRLSDWILLNILGLRRNKNTPVERLKDKLCCNYYVTSDNLHIRQHNKRNALEIAELIPVFDRHNGYTYYQLLQSNQWIKKYFPRWYQNTIEDLQNGFYSHSKKQVLQSTDPVQRFLSIILNIVEIGAGLGQQFWIKLHNKKSTIQLFAREYVFWPTKRPNH